MKQFVITTTILLAGVILGARFLSWQHRQDNANSWYQACLSTHSAGAMECWTEAQQLRNT